MRKIRASLFALLVVAGCHLRGGDHITGGELGRVVIYRNGVAFYERHATVEDGKITVRVPRERVDDFLKSLTIVDLATKKPLAVTIPRNQDSSGSFLAMTLEVPESRSEVLLTYVTEAPAWKPSYRVVVGKNGKLMLESWAVVDNTTSEDWNKVLVGVGASSALAFRYDLWSVHTIDRDLLQGEDRFAIAPPTGVSPYSDNNEVEELVAIAGNDIKGTPGGTAATGPVANATTPAKPTGRTFSAALGSAAGSTGDATGVAYSGSSQQENQYYVDGINTTGLKFGSASPPPAPNSGVIHGRVLDSKSGEGLAGVTVVVTGPNLPGTQTAIADERGEYAISNIPPGSYKTTFYYSDVTVERSGVNIYANKTTNLYQKLNPSASGGEVIMIRSEAPTIDPTSTTTGITINKNYTKNIPTPGRSYESTGGRNTRRTGSTVGDDFGGFQHVDTGSRGGDEYRAAKPSAPPPVPNHDDEIKAIVAKVQSSKKNVVVEVHGPAGTEQQAIARGQTVKNKLVDDGVPAGRVFIVPKIGQGESETVRLLAVAPTIKPDAAGSQAKNASRITPGDTAVGESHFIADRPMTIKAGSSAMVAMVHGETSGGVVYLYDPVSDRGDKRFAFKAVRLDNPTDDTLEPGPVTVYGDGKFIGEGITEPVPPRAAAVIPFALDKQIVVERTGAESDQIAKLVTVSRGILTAQVQHRRETKFTVTSRLAAPTTVFLRHRLESGWALVDNPQHYTRVGDSHLFEVQLAPGETKYVTVAEATPLERTFDLSTDESLAAIKVFINEPKASPTLKRQVEALLATHASAVDIVSQIDTLRDQLVEYRSRSGELHAQLVTLKAVRTGGDLMTTLKAKLAEMSDRTQKATIAIVELQEKLMLTRVKFQNQLADLKLTDVTSKEVSTR